MSKSTFTADRYKKVLTQVKKSDVRTPKTGKIKNQNYAKVSLDIKANEDVLDDKCALSVEKIKPITYTPEYGYYFSLGKKLGKAHSIGKRINKE